MSYAKRYPSKKARRAAAMREASRPERPDPPLPVPEDNDGEYEEPVKDETARLARSLEKRGVTPAAILRGYAKMMRAT